jgi:predicted lactoylglutathione lyase
MTKMIFISLPVTNLKASLAFYTALGFTHNAQFSEEGAAAYMVWSDTINLMLLTHEKWSSFTTRPIPPPTSSEVGFSLTCDTREAVDAMNAAAGKNGGTSDVNPVQDHGTMYGRDMMDPDGHIWGAMWFDPAAAAA